MATPTYQELAQLAASSEFIDRGSIAVTKYAQFIINEDPATPLHNNRVNWAKSAYLNPRAEIIRISYATVFEDAIKTRDPLNFAGMTDAQLQPVVEAIINTTLLKF